MGNKFIINLVPGETYLHKLSGATKTRLFAVLIVVTVMTFDLRIMLPLFAASVIGFLSIKPNFKQLWWLFAIVLMSNLLNIVLFWLASPNAGMEYCGGKTILFYLNGWLYLTSETLWYLLSRLVKMLTTFLVSLVYILTITPSELSAGLYSLGIPYKICAVVGLALRYIPDIGRDYTNISISMQCRGMELDSKRAGLMTRLKQMILILVPLIISSFDRIGNIANAMDLRGFGKKKKRSYYAEHEPTQADKLFKVVYCAIGLFCIAYIVSRWIWPPEVIIWYPF